MLSKSQEIRKMRKSIFCLCLVLTIILSLTPMINVNAAASELHVDGNLIKNAAGAVVRLTGTCIPSLEWSEAGENMTANFTESFDNWKANCIRLPLNQDFWFGHGQYQGGSYTGYRNLVNTLVNMAVSRNKYVIFDLHWSDMGTWGSNNTQHNMPDDNSTAFWQSICSIYGNNPSVLFGLYNEPHDVSWNVWKNGGNVTEGSVTYHTPGHQALINTVRSAGARNIVVVGGLDWAYDLRGIDSGYALTDPNGNGIMYDAHIYPWKSDWDAYVTCAADTNPILVGECGWDDPQWYRDAVNPNWHAEPHTSWCPTLLNWLDSHQYNWTAWSFHPGATPNLLTDWNYNVSAHWGAYAKPRLQSYAGVGATPVPTATPVPGAGVVYEAENGTYGVGAIQQNASNASGGKVIGTINSQGAYSQVNSVNGGSGGTAAVVIRFANGYSNNRSLSLYVNGAKQQQLTFAPTGSWNTFAETQAIPVALNSGTANTIKLQRDSSDVAAADIDKFTVTVAGGATPTPTPVPTPTPTPGGAGSPIIQLLFNENNGTGTANTGSSSRSYPSAAITATRPVWSTNTVPNGGTSSLDWGTAFGNYAVDIAGQINDLKDLKSFTITGWVNCRNAAEGEGGNRIVSWINNGGDGADLVFKSDGSLQIGIGQWPDSSPARSSAGKISVDANAGASNWRFFAVTYDASLASAQVKFYFGTPSADAALDVSKDYNRGNAGSNIGPSFTVGHFNTATRSGATDRMFRGLIDQIRVYGSKTDSTGALSLLQIVSVQGRN